MRLIDADDLKKWITSFKSCGIKAFSISKIVSFIDGEETAFALEDVIAQIKEQLKECEDYYNKYGGCGNQIYAYKKCLEIIEYHMPLESEVEE